MSDQKGFKTLYIIGNGFDRYHRLDTRYHSFAFFLKKRYSDIYDLLIEYYNLSDLDLDDKESYLDPTWANFENALSSLNIDSVLEDNADYMADISSDDFSDRDWHSYQIQMELINEKITTDLFAAFKEFILKLEFPDNIDNIKLSIFNIDSVFLNFNYTDTLERYYFIQSKRIYYIHGKAKNESDELILGHAIDPNTFIPKKVVPPKGLDKEQMDMWMEQMSDEYDYSYESAKSEILSYFRQSFKPTVEIIQNNMALFNNLKNIKRVFVLGHSLADVDKPYLKKVIESVDKNNTQWIVSYYTEKERISHLDSLRTLGLRDDNISLVKLEELKLFEPSLFG